MSSLFVYSPAPISPHTQLPRLGYGAGSDTPPEMEANENDHVYHNQIQSRPVASQAQTQGQGQEQDLQDSHVSHETQLPQFSSISRDRGYNKHHQQLYGTPRRRDSISALSAPVNGVEDAQHWDATDNFAFHATGGNTLFANDPLSDASANLNENGAVSDFLAEDEFKYESMALNNNMNNNVPILSHSQSHGVRHMNLNNNNNNNNTNNTNNNTSRKSRNDETQTVTKPNNNTNITKQQHNNSTNNVNQTNGKKLNSYSNSLNTNNSNNHMHPSRSNPQTQEFQTLATLTSDPSSNNSISSLPHRRIIVVTNRLPVTVQKKPN